ncbi:hypothetical protein [Microbacterium laevaniformans]|uniref:hypothetical protein n=1 Tax=Microbacterium laevaniformans TaxID=36807 RepID=UPI003D953165
MTSTSIRPPRVPAARATLATLTAKPGDEPRDTPQVREFISILEHEYGPELVADIIGMRKSAAAIAAAAHTISRNDARRARWTIFGLQFDPTYLEWLRSDLSNQAIAAACGLNRSTVGEHRAALYAGDAAETATTPDELAGDAEGDSHSVNADGSENWSLVGQRPWGREHYKAFIRDHGDDPERTHFTYGWTSNPHGGGWNKLNNVRPKTPQELIADDLTLDLPTLYARASELAQENTPRLGTFPSGRTLFVNVADWQVGKTGSRGGTPELVARLKAARTELRAEIERREPSSIVLIDLGDGIENFESGGNPAFTNDLSLPDQLDVYATELYEFVALCADYAPVKVGIVPSNHSAWRRGKQQLGKPTDDFGIHVHRQVEKTAKAGGLDAEWIYPDEYSEIIVVEVPGDICGFVHGNQFNSNGAIQFWERQAFGGPLAPCGTLVSGHYHSYACLSAGVHPTTGRERWWLQAPTLDAGSDWFRNLRGRESLPGTLIFEVDPDTGFDLRSIAIL